MDASSDSFASRVVEEFDGAGVDSMGDLPVVLLAAPSWKDSRRPASTSTS